jgi:molybdopterin/thiamine biosynthesis adenylyltransferase
LLSKLVHRKKSQLSSIISTIAYLALFFKNQSEVCKYLQIYLPTQNIFDFYFEAKYGVLAKKCKFKYTGYKKIRRNFMGYERYSRHISMRQIGPDGQKRLLSSSALVIGAGGLGSTLLYCLAGAGVGRIGVMDGDTVSMSNLNRQFLHFEKDIGTPKVDSALEKLRAFNSTLEYVPIKDIITSENAEEYISDYDVIILSVDNLETRFVVNEACCRLKKPLINGGVDGMLGMLNLIIPGETPCLRCLYRMPESPVRNPSSFAPVVSCISALEANLAAQVLLGCPPLPFDRVILFFGDDLSWHTEHASRREDCPVCGRL